MTWSTYPIESKWMADSLMPAEIGVRTELMLRQLGRLSPAMSNWRLLERPSSIAVPLTEATPNLTAFVENNVWFDDYDEPDPESGYCLLARGSAVVRDVGTPDTIDIAVTAGSKWHNSAEFEVGALQLPKDFNLISYPIYRGAMDAIVSAWPCPWAIAYTFSAGVPPVDSTTSDRRSPFDVAWIGYLSAPLAKELTPSPGLVADPTPGGGVILSAVQERIDASDPKHMLLSRALEAIMVERVGVARRVTPADHPARVGPY